VPEGGKRGELKKPRLRKKEGPGGGPIRMIGVLDQKKGEGGKTTNCFKDAQSVPQQRKKMYPDA